MLTEQGFSVRTTSRRESEVATNSDSHDIAYFDLDSVDNDYDSLLNGVDIVVHLAARVHIMSSSGEKSEAKVFETINVLGTKRLVEESIRKGVKRFVYLSSAKVAGESNLSGENGACIPFKEDDEPCPKDAYAISKLNAEHAIASICNKSETEFVILRPPLVYGPGVKANFLFLIKVVKKGIPLPLKAVRNKRSLLYVGNLVGAICLCLKDPNVTNKTYFLSDIDISVPELVRKIAFLLDKEIWLLNIPVKALKLTGIFLGKKAMVDRLTDSLLVDSRLFRDDTNWAFPYTAEMGLEETIDWYLCDSNN